MNKALLVSDSAEFLETTALALKQEPYFVTGVRSADEARVVMAREPVGVVVVDETIAGAPGAEFLVELQQENPTIPRLFLATSLDTDGALRLINQAKVDRVLCKPCNSEELASTIRGLLRKQSVSNLTDRVVQLARRQASLVEELNREVSLVSMGDRSLGGISSTQETMAVQHHQHAPPMRTRSYAFDGGAGGPGYAGNYSGPIGYTEGDPIANLTALEAHSLSRREKEILRAVAAGQKPRDMARLFFISVHTARNHIKSIYRKLGVHAQGELMAKVLNAPGRDRYTQAAG